MVEERLRSLVGLLMLMAIAWLFCPRDGRRRIVWRAIGWGVVLQFLLAIIILRLPWAGAFFRGCGELVNGLLAHALEGAKLPFGVLTNQAKLGEVFGPENATIFAVQQLAPTIIFFSALTSVGYQLGVLQWMVGFVARAVVRVMGTSGAETLSAAGNIFLGMVEAPLTIRPYLVALTRSELFCVMVCGLSNLAGSVLAVYAGLLHDVLPTAAGHLVTMSVMSMPAGLVIAKIMLPETGTPATLGRVEVVAEKPYANVMDAITAGAADGLRVAAGVVAMLIAMVAIVSLCNGVIGAPARWHNQAIVQAAAAPDVKPEDAAGVQAAADRAGLQSRAWHAPTLQGTLGVAFRPLAWGLGVSRQDIPRVGELLGLRTVLNEFLAYLQMGSDLKANPTAMTQRSRILTTYALCSFANFGSVAILLGGVGVLAPSRRRELAELGIPSLVGGTLAAHMTACVVGMLI
ncbi:MAG: NupC/NupG family nucleoside CNT transporter [Armatimonadetes bacterium]|nr:NupC/NupG family nucleoside CNT transporter [Armatimonadota bacterium]